MNKKYAKVSLKSENNVEIDLRINLNYSDLKGQLYEISKELEKRFNDFNLENIYFFEDKPSLSSEEIANLENFRSELNKNEIIRN